MSWDEALAQFAWMLLGLSYIAVGMARLRVFATAALAAAATWLWLHPTPTTRVVLGWVAIMLAANAVQFARLVIARRGARPSPEARAIAVGPFANLDPALLGRLARAGTRTTIASGRALIAQGAPVTMLYLILDGSVDVTVSGRHVATLGPGTFVGEMGLVTGEPASATVTAHQDLSVFGIGQPALKHMMVLDPDLEAAIAGRLGRDLALKLRRGTVGDAR